MEYDLPDEMLLEIFSNLDIRTLTRTCRFVCRRWRAIVTLVMPRQLVIGDDRSQRHSERHWLSNEPIDEQVVLKFDLAFFNCVPLNLTRLQRLKIRGDLGRLELALLNELKRLKHLELSLIKLKEETTLVLPELKILNLFGIAGRPLHLKLPALEILACLFGLDKLSLADPKTVRRLHLAYDCGDLRTLHLYANLTEFATNHPSLLSKSIIERLPRLKRLRLIKDEEMTPFNFEMTANRMAELFKQKRALGVDLQIFFNDILLKDERAFYERQFLIEQAQCFEVS